MRRVLPDVPSRGGGVAGHETTTSPSPTPAQYSPLSPQQPSPPPPPQPSPPPPSQPPSTEHSQPTSSPSSNPSSSSPPNPPWKHPPRWLLRLTPKLKTCSLNLPLSLTIAPTSQMFTGFLNTRTSRLLLPPLPSPHAYLPQCTVTVFTAAASQCTQHPNPYSSTCTPASEAIAYVTSRTTRTMPNSTPANQSRNYVQCPNCLL